MKNIYLLALCSVLFLNLSCSGEDDSEEASAVEEAANAEEQVVSGPLSVEEGKQQLEENTLAIIDKIEAFKNDDALNEIVELAEFLGGGELLSEEDDDYADTDVVVAEEYISEEVVLKTISNIANLEPTTEGIVVFNAKQAVTLANKEISDDFDDAKGIYTWNADTEEFDETGSSDDLIYNMTYNDGKTAVFSITDFSTTLAGADSDEELPTLAKATLKIDGVTVFSQDFSASFNSGQLIPAKIENTTTLGGFSMETSYTNSNNTSITQSFELGLGDTVIIGYGLTTNGDFKSDLEGNVEDVVDDATINIQLLNANLELSAEDTGFDSDSELSIQELVDLLNSNIDATLSVNNNTVATGEFYKDEDTYTDYEYIFNGETYEFNEYEVTEDVVNARFLFDDGTKNDFDTYIDGSFTSVENEFETVFEAFEELFSGI